MSNSNNTRDDFFDIGKLLHMNKMLQEALATIRINIASFTKVHNCINTFGAVQCYFYRFYVILTFCAFK